MLQSSWLFLSVVATLSGTLVLASIYTYLAASEKNSALGKWAVSWWVHLLRFILLLFILKYWPHPLLLIGNQSAALFNGFFLLWGTCDFLGIKIKRHWLILTAVNQAWILYASFAGVTFFVLSIPTFIFLGFIYIWTGITLLRNGQIKGPEITLTSYAFIVWGIHKLDYPFLMPIHWLAPWGFLLAAILEFLIAAGILLTYFKKNKVSLNEALESYKASEDRLQSLLMLHEKRTLQEGDLFSYALEEAERLTQSNCAYLHFVDADEDSISLNSWSKKTLEMCTAEKTPHYPLKSAGIWADCVRQRQPVIHNDYPNYPDKKGYPEGHFPLQRHMSVPIFDQNKIVAIIGVGNKEEPYTEDDKRQLSLFFASTWDIIKQKRYEEEKKKIKAQLQQSQKMEAIGTLAGGIAHDFNNILGIILGYADLVKLQAPKWGEHAEGLDKILQAAHRAKDLVHQILAFSRQAKSERISLSPQPIIKEALKMLRASLPSTIKIEEKIDGQCGAINADPTQLHQILMNICTNALHAMEDKGGELKISLQTADSLPVELQENPKHRPEEFLWLSISDTGPGIGADIIDHIFDPFFTTKEKDKGTGMGLAITYGIIKEYGGAITVNSELGKGTTFNIYLPKSAEQPITPLVSEKTVSKEGSERILFVDDEELLTTIGKDMLEKLGYQVTTKLKSEEALEFFKSRPDSFDLVITDQTMPNMTGLELSKKILEIRPDMPIILCTGYSTFVTEEIARAQGIKEFAMKPLTLDVLTELTRKALDESAQK